MSVMNTKVWKRADGLERTERTVNPADPTVTVTWRVYSTDPKGVIDKNVYIELVEAHGFYQGKFINRDKPVFEFSEVTAKQIHGDLEEKYDEDVASREDDEPRIYM